MIVRSLFLGFLCSFGCRNESAPQEPQQGLEFTITIPSDTAEADSAVDTAAANEPAAIVVRQEDPMGEILVPPGVNGTYLGFTLENTGDRDARFQSLVVNAIGDLDGPANGMAGDLSPAARHQFCSLSDNTFRILLDSDIIRVARNGTDEAVRFTFFHVLPANRTVRFSISCLRDPNIGIPDDGEYYSLSIQSENVGSDVPVTAYDIYGNETPINAMPFTWARYAP